MSTSCKTKDEEDADGLCESDASAPMRFYQVEVKADDYGGNSANATATVVVVPKIIDRDVLSDEKYFARVIGKSSQRYVLESTSLEWDI